MTSLLFVSFSNYILQDFYTSSPYKVECHMITLVQKKSDTSYYVYNIEQTFSEQLRFFPNVYGSTNVNNAINYQLSVSSTLDRH